jgi:DNA-nicking Smr family endonuclease
MAEDIVRMPIEDVLDLHTFLPKEVPDLLDDYFEACRQKGIFSVRVIHGKGRGILKQRVRSILKRHPLVEGYGDAPGDGGGWGATLVTLKSHGLK